MLEDRVVDLPRSGRRSEILGKGIYGTFEVWVLRPCAGGRSAGKEDVRLASLVSGALSCLASTR